MSSIRATIRASSRAGVKDGHHHAFADGAPRAGRGPKPLRMEPIIDVQTHTQAGRHHALAGVPRAPITITAQDIVLRHLQTPSDIEAVQHLREGIDLSVHAADSNFMRLEKKETTSGWWLPSSWMARS
jgi:hypothetical protein